MGHAFNLLHSWQKHLGYPWEPLERPLTPEPKALSFMNYPYNFDSKTGGKEFFKTLSIVLVIKNCCLCGTHLSALYKWVMLTGL